MFAALKMKSLKWLSGQLNHFACPACGHSFIPFQDQAPSSWSDNIICPQCGHAVPIKDALAVQQEMKVNPTGPISQPTGTKIEKKTVSESELLFFIPATGRWGGMLFFAVFWNAISWTLFLAFLSGSTRGHLPWQPVLFTVLFPTVGLGLAYAAVRSRFAVHLLYLGPDRIRLQRQLFGRRKNFDLATSCVESVLKKEFYQQNYKPVYGVEIKASNGKIRFGSALTEDEKNWLCWEIREFIKTCA